METGRTLRGHVLTCFCSQLYGIPSFIRVSDFWLTANFYMLGIYSLPRGSIVTNFRFAEWRIWLGKGPWSSSWFVLESTKGTAQGVQTLIWPHGDQMVSPQWLGRTLRHNKRHVRSNAVQIGKWEAQWRNQCEAFCWHQSQYSFSRKEAQCERSDRLSPLSIWKLIFLPAMSKTTWALRWS